MKKLILIILLLLSAASAHAYNITWSRTNGTYGGYAIRLAIPSTESNTAFFLPYGGGVFRSTDEGQNWSLYGSTFGVTSNIAVDPTNSQKIYAGSGNTVKFSSDKGATWGPIPNISISNPFIDPSFTSIAIDPKNTSKVYAINSPKILKIDTSKNPCTWEMCATPEGAAAGLFILAVSPANSYIFAGTGIGLSRSSDEGATWTRIATSGAGALTQYSVFEIFPFSSKIYARIYEGVIKSSADEGNTWQTVNISPFLSSSFMAVKANDPNVIYAVIDGQVRTSFNGGLTWNYASAGLPEYNRYPVTSVVISPSNSSVAYASTNGDGIYKTANAGTSWTRVNNGFFGNAVGDLSVDPVTHYVYAGTKSDFPGIKASGIYRSVNKGISWESLSNGIFVEDELRRIEVDLRHAGHVYAGGGNDYRKSGMLKSANYGDYWVGINNGLTNLHVTDIKIDYPSGETLSHVYAATKGDGVFKGIAGGSGVSTWARLPTTGLGNQYVLCLALDSTPEGHSLYAGTEFGGVFKFNLSGATWETLSGNLPQSVSIYSLAVDPANPAIIVAGTSSGLYVRGVGGTWSTSKDLGGSSTRIINSLYVDTWAFPNIFYAGTNNGIYQSTNEGASWTSVSSYNNNISLFGANVASIARDEGDFTFYTAAVSVNYYGVSKGVPDIQVPPTPSYFIGTAESPTNIRWSWAQVSGELGYKLYEPPATLKATMGENVTSKTETGLSPNTSYTRYVTAFSTLESGASNTYGIYTLANPPTILRSISIEGDAVELNWNTNLNPAGTKYVVMLSTAEAGPFTDYVSYEVDPPCSVESLTPRTDYWFKVYAVNHNNIPTVSTEAASIETTHETQGPRIYNIRFDGIPLFEGDVIRPNPLITADITDESTSPEAFSPVSKEATSLNFSAYYVILGTELNSFNYSTAEGVYKLSHKLSVPLGPGTYTFYVTARDELGNVGTSAPRRVRVMSGGVATVGPVLTMPTPFKPATEGGNVTIAYTLSTDGPVDIYMYDIGGKVVLRKKFGSGTNGGRTGYNEMKWNGTTDFGRVVGNGIYVYKIISKGKVIGKGKIVVYD